jgi:uncharacterized membrane protein
MRKFDLDIFIEQLVKAKRSAGRTALKVLLTVLPVCVGVAILIFVPMEFYSFAILFVVGLGWLAWYLTGMQDIEYEYALTNTDLDIDKITAKRSRKRLITIKVTSFTDYCKVSETDNTAPDQNVKVIDVSGDTGDVYAAYCSHDRIGKILLYFTPNEEFAENLKKVFPRELKQKMLRKN